MRSGWCSHSSSRPRSRRGRPRLRRAPTTIDDQEAYVAQIADRLDALENRIGELDEEYGATLDRIDVLEAEIAGSQAESMRSASSSQSSRGS
jgi:hypothetical protein